MQAKVTYSVLDVREITSKDAQGKPRKSQLVRLLNPWAGISEWQGPCSDYDSDFWSPETKAAFSSCNQLEEQEGSASRLMHDWGRRNDGVFVMQLKDFLTHFNQLKIVRPLDPSWFEVKFLRSFLPSFGCLSAKTQEWLSNP